MRDLLSPLIFRSAAPPEPALVGLWTSSGETLELRKDGIYTLAGSETGSAA